METTRFGGLRRFLALAVAARYYLALLFGQRLLFFTTPTVGWKKLVVILKLSRQFLIGSVSPPEGQIEYSRDRS